MMREVKMFRHSGIECGEVHYEKSFAIQDPKQCGRDEQWHIVDAELEVVCVCMSADAAAVVLVGLNGLLDRLDCEARGVDVGWPSNSLGVEARRANRFADELRKFGVDPETLDI